MTDITEETIQELSSLVWGIVRKRGPERYWEDLAQAGFEGILLAAQNYDPNHDSNASFSTFAYRYIWAQISEEYRALKDTISRYSTRASRKISNRIGKVDPSASIEEKAELIGVGVEELREWLQVGIVDMGEDSNFEPAVGPVVDENLGLREKVAQIAKGLSEVERTILYSRLYTSDEPLSQTELSRQLGVSRHWVWQKENECLEILRQNLGATP